MRNPATAQWRAPVLALTFTSALRARATALRPLVTARRLRPAALCCLARPKRKDALGFTLVEFVLASSLAVLLATALVSVFTRYYSELEQSNQAFVRQQQTQYWLHWLWRDLHRQALVDQRPSYHADQQCLLYGEAGVRIRNTHLQWRPAGATCDSNGWQALHDPAQVRFRALEWSPEALCLTSRSVSGPARLYKECMSWPPF